MDFYLKGKATCWINRPKFLPLKWIFTLRGRWRAEPIVLSFYLWRCDTTGSEAPLKLPLHDIFANFQLLEIKLLPLDSTLSSGSQVRGHDKARQQTALDINPALAIKQEFSQEDKVRIQMVSLSALIKKFFVYFLASGAVGFWCASSPVFVRSPQTISPLAIWQMPLQLVWSRYAHAGNACLGWRCLRSLHNGIVLNMFVL